MKKVPIISHLSRKITHFVLKRCVIITSCFLDAVKFYTFLCVEFSLNGSKLETKAKH